MLKRIDINSDLGERPEALLDGSEEQLIKHITSANIACGAHAGDVHTMERVIHLCKNYGVGVGAHPSYPDGANFGRTEMNLPPDEIETCVYEQVKLLTEIAHRMGCDVQHVKPHGALYNSASKDWRIAAAVAKGVARINTRLVLFGLAGSRMLDVWQKKGFIVAGEAFADRRYDADGSLRSRKHPDALITDPHEAARQALRIAKEGIIVAIDGTDLAVDAATICIHSDTSNSPAIAAEVRQTLHAAGIEVKPLLAVIS